MSLVMAGALGTAISCTIWMYIASLAALVGWLGFAGCTSYFTSGGGKEGFKRSLICNLVGCGWAMVIIMFSASISAGAIVGAIITGVITWVMCYQARIDIVKTVPNTFFGCFSTFAANGDWKMVALCLVLGNILGLCCDYSGKFIFKVFGKKEPEAAELAE